MTEVKRQAGIRPTTQESAYLVPDNSTRCLSSSYELLSCTSFRSPGKTWKKTAEMVDLKDPTPVQGAPKLFARIATDWALRLFFLRLPFGLELRAERRSGPAAKRKARSTCVCTRALRWKTIELPRGGRDRSGVEPHHRHGDHGKRLHNQVVGLCHLRQV